MTETYTDFAVYAAAATDGEVLYVGQTNDLRRRVQEHRRLSAWWSRVSRVHLLQHCIDRASALDCEQRLIETHKPKYNQVHGQREDAAQNVALERLCTEQSVAADGSLAAKAVGRDDLIRILAAASSRRAAEEATILAAKRLLRLCEKHDVDTVAEAIRFEDGAS